ncbi:MAG: peptide chain release factor N(5)-glutamine methyltransferase [Melioribacteraceae bacterium]|nr:peptide chain release factor N(5)-glutamine methyltransferase [Melioribacteraceae bacterium]WKZ71181.1 MAG: peptide chain release factor N(5)-glutamine methyltransferase [Melioribacteraceae bacterium]
MNNKNQILTVLNAIQLSTSYLEEKGIESPRMNAELLLAHVLQCKRLDLYLAFDRPLLEEEIVQLREFIARRGKFEPLQYILGEVEFYNLNFKVDKSVLIPRPETELLVDEAINLINEYNYTNILDVGTGSGNIPVSLAANLNGVTITSIDISKEAIDTAVKNAEKNNVRDKINFIISDIADYVPDQKFDVIVSNPPYVSSQEYQNLQKEITAYEPRESVTDNDDGFKFYRNILSNNDRLLRSNGFVIFEIGQGQESTLYKLFEEHSFEHVKTIKDLQNIDRIILGRIK